jgi:hypothetical protein
MVSCICSIPAVLALRRRFEASASYHEDGVARAAAVSISVRPLRDGLVNSRRAVRVVHDRHDVPDDEHAFTFGQGAAALGIDEGRQGRAHIIADAASTLVVKRFEAPGSRVK